MNLSHTRQLENELASLKAERDVMRQDLRDQRATIQALHRLCERIILVHEQVVMDTEEDRALHDQAVEAFKGLLTAIMIKESSNEVLTQASDRDRPDQGTGAG